MCGSEVSLWRPVLSALFHCHAFTSLPLCVQAFVTELNAKHAELDAALICGRQILDLAHVEAVPIVQAKVHELDKKWSKLKTAAGERSEELATALLEMKGLQDVLDKLLAWVDEAETWMDTKDLEPVEEELEAIEMQLAEHEVCGCVDGCGWVWVGVGGWVCMCARVV